MAQQSAQATSNWESRTPIQKSYWSAQEDKMLKDLVGTFGPKNWSRIAKSFKGRIGKQCRERWRNHLNPDIRKDPFTPEEDLKIVQLVAEVGTKWTQIAHSLPGRTDNSIKNRYYSSLKRSHQTPASSKCVSNPAVETLLSTQQHEPIPVQSTSHPPNETKLPSGSQTTVSHTSSPPANLSTTESASTSTVFATANQTATSSHSVAPTTSSWLTTAKVKEQFQAQGTKRQPEEDVASIPASPGHHDTEDEPPKSSPRPKRARLESPKPPFANPPNTFPHHHHLSWQDSSWQQQHYWSAWQPYQNTSTHYSHPLQFSPPCHYPNPYQHFPPYFDQNTRSFPMTTPVPRHHGQQQQQQQAPPPPPVSNGDTNQLTLQVQYLGATIQDPSLVWSSIVALCELRALHQQPTES